jgi:hypothetical protein
VNHSPLQILRTQRSNLEEQHAQVPLPSEGPPIPLSKKLTNIGTEHCTQQFQVRAPEQLLHQKSLLKRASQPHFHLRARSPSKKILMKTATTTTKILVMVFRSYELRVPPLYCTCTSTRLIIGGENILTPLLLWILRTKTSIARRKCFAKRSGEKRLWRGTLGVLHRKFRVLHQK